MLAVLVHIREVEVYAVKCFAVTVTRDCSKKNFLHVEL